MDLSLLNPNSPAWRAAVAGTYINRALRGARTNAETLAANGWTASLETSATIGTRVTATRLLTLGFFALAAKKQTGELYVLFTSPDGTDQQMASVPARQGASAHQWIINYNRTVTHH